MNDSRDLTILPFQPANQVEVRNLILTGLAEHWGFIDHSKNPDLNDISSSYANATFLVAWFQDRIVGTGAVVPESEGVARITRMSVVSSMRRRGIGRLILRELCERARVAGCHRIVLETTATWHEVIEFYKHCGFQITHSDSESVYFSLDLAERTLDSTVRKTEDARTPNNRTPTTPTVRLSGIVGWLLTGR